MTTKPSQINRIWSETGTETDPGTAKYLTGWVVEKPPYQYMNFIQRVLTQAAKHNNEEGINKWDSSTNYPQNAYTKGSDGNLYKANAAN